MKKLLILTALLISTLSTQAQRLLGWDEWQASKSEAALYQTAQDLDSLPAGIGMKRFLSIDPLARQFPYLTPYQFASNKPITFIDLDGLEAVFPYPNDGEGKLEKVEKINLPIHPGYFQSAHYKITHSFNNTQTTVSAGIENNPAFVGVGIENLTKIWKARNISNAIPGESGDADRVLNHFSNHVSDRIFDTDKDFEKNKKDNMTDYYGKVFRHQLWQGILTILYGEKFANELGLAQERQYLSEDNENSIKRENSFRDLINNAYGRELGKNFKGDITTREGLVEFLNIIADNVISSFPTLNEKIPNDALNTRKPFTINSPGVENLHNEIK